MIYMYYRMYVLSFISVTRGAYDNETQCVLLYCVLLYCMVIHMSYLSLRCCVCCKASEEEEEAEEEEDLRGGLI